MLGRTVAPKSSECGKLNLTQVVLTFRYIIPIVDIIIGCQAVNAQGKNGLPPHYFSVYGFDVWQRLAIAIVGQTLITNY